MPPSWLRHLGEHQSKVPLPDLEHADWSRGLALGQDGEDGSRSGSTLTQSPFAEGLLSTSNIALHGEVCALAVEPVQGYLAVGTTVGSIHLFGHASVQIDWTLRPANKIQHLAFKSGSPLLIAIDVKDNISIFDISRNDPQTRAKASAAQHPFQPVPSTTRGSGPNGPLHPDTPMRIGAHTARNGILCVELSPLHDHLFLGLRDGTVDTYDLDRLSPSQYRVPNLWWEEEEILRKSGVPDAPNRRHVPLIVDIKTHPKDINQLLLAYEGGVVLLDVKQRAVIRSFQLRHLPGAMGAGAGNPDAMWTERAAPATCVAWRPDGILFACGHEDGCISIWHVEDDDKPVMVRTLDTIDADKPDSTALDNESNWPRAREPIFKLTWSGFPAQPWRNFEKAAAQFQGTPQSLKEGSQEEIQTGSLLTVLGGATERHPPGIACLHFPPFSWPASSYWNPKSHEAVVKITQALRKSVMETHGSRYATSSTIEDYILLPRDNPYYGLSYDPVAIVMLSSADPSLPSLPPPAAARGLKAFAFPPHTTPNPATQQAAATSNSRIQLPFAQRPLQLPLALSSAGPGAILGAEIVSVNIHTYRQLTGNTEYRTSFPGSPTSPAASAAHASQAQSSSSMSLPLRGGFAQPTAIGTASQSPEAMTSLARAEHHRIIVTWHLDGTVRFADASPHLLLTSKMSSATDEDGTAPKIFLDDAFPNPLPDLTIDTWELIYSETMMGHPLFDRLRDDVSRQRIQCVKFAPEAMEVAIALRAGQVFHYKFGLARLSETEEMSAAVAQDVQHDEEMAARMAQHQFSPLPDNKSASQELDSTMAGAFGDLDLANTHNNVRRGSAQTSQPSLSTGMSEITPPPRPKRDPKRASVARKLRLGRHSQELSSQDAPAPTQSQLQEQQPQSMKPVEEISSLGHLASWSVDGFKPNIVVDSSRGEVTALEVSDIGFLAIANGTALSVIDLRGPEMLVHEGFGESDSSSTDMNREERKMMEEESKSAVRQMRLSVCRSAVNPALTPTLIVVRENGYTTFWALDKGSLDVWIAQRTHGSNIEELNHCVDLKILDMAGNVCMTQPAELQRSLREHARDVSVDFNKDMNSMLCIGRMSLSLRIGLSGPRIGKADVNEPIKAAGVVDRRGEKICLVICATSIFVYSLPHLRLLSRIQRHNRAHEERLSLAEATISLDSSGDFIEVANSLDVCMWTVFATSPRPGMPSLLLYKPTALPIAPNAIGSAASGLVNWIGGKSSALTQGAQLDEMLAGGKRAEPPKLPEQKYVVIQMEEQQEAERLQNQKGVPTATQSSTRGGRSSASASSTNRAGQEAQNAYGTAAWTADLARQRGEMMNNLEEGLSSLERGASSWMKSARESMVKQAARDKLNKFF